MPRIRVGFINRADVALSLALLSCWPYALLALGRHTPELWLLAFGYSTLCALVLWQVARQCSTPDFSYWRGLVIIARSTTTYWYWLSWLVVLPALWVTVTASTCFVLQSATIGAAASPAWRFQRLVRRFYDWRLRP